MATDVFFFFFKSSEWNVTYPGRWWHTHTHTLTHLNIWCCSTGPHSSLTNAIVVLNVCYVWRETKQYRPVRRATCIKQEACGTESSCTRGINSKRRQTMAHGRHFLYVFLCFCPEASGCTADISSQSIFLLFFTLDQNTVSSFCSDAQCLVSASGRFVFHCTRGWKVFHLKRQTKSIVMVFKQVHVYQMSAASYWITDLSCSIVHYNIVNCKIRRNVLVYFYLNGCKDNSQGWF